MNLNSILIDVAAQPSFFKIDVMKLLSPFLNENQTKDMTSETISKQLRKVSEDFFSQSSPQQTKWLTFHHFLDKQNYYQFLKCLLLLKKWELVRAENSQLTFVFFKTIALCSPTINELCFSNCKLSSRAAQYISLMNTRQLTSLFLFNDKFGNASLKLLMKLDLPFLLGFQLGNTDLTSDCIHLLAKNPREYKNIAFLCQEKFNNIKFIKSAPQVMKIVNKIVLFGLISTDRCYSFIYLPHLAKLKFQTEERIKLFFDLVNVYSQELTSIIHLPYKVFHKLAKVFELSYQRHRLVGEE